MARVYEPCGQRTVKINDLMYAVPKDIDRTTYWANRSNVRGNWRNVMQEHKTARVMQNYRFKVY